jgi:hypothetical protein
VGLTLKPLKQKSAFLIQEPLTGSLFGHPLTDHRMSIIEKISIISKKLNTLWPSGGLLITATEKIHLVAMRWTFNLHHKKSHL